MFSLEQKAMLIGALVCLNSFVVGCAPPAVSILESTQLGAAAELASDVDQKDAENTAPTLASLCSKAIEGSYQSHGENYMTLNIVCLDDHTMAAMLAIHSGPKETAVIMNRISFNYTSIDDGRLILSTTPIDAADRPTIPSNAAFTWMAIDLQVISQKGFVAKFLALNLGTELELYFVRNSHVQMPTLLPVGGTFPARIVEGSYYVSQSKFGPLTIDLNIFDNVPYISVRVEQTGLALHMVFGPAWQETGLISTIGTTGDMVLNAMPIYYLRGRMLNADKFEFYIVNSEQVVGPYIANRIHAPRIAQL